MKKFSVFYLIFVVLLSALPCSDESEAYNFTQTAAVNIAHDIDEGKMENCSPICTCTCCGQSIVEIEVANLTIKASLLPLDKHDSAYNFLLQQRNKNIWHPPKLA